MEDNAKTVDAQVKASEETSAKEGRTFTQEEVNSLLARERKSTEAKYSDYVEKAKKFDEFEECETAESKFAHAMDNLQPILLNNSKLHKMLS